MRARTQRRAAAAIIVVALAVAACTNPMKETVAAIVEEHSRPRAEPTVPSGWGIAPDTPIVITFSETIDTSTAELSGTALAESDGASWSRTFEPDDTLTVAPASTWSPSGTKTLTVRAQDLQTYDLEPLELEYTVLDGAVYVRGGDGSDDNPGTSGLPKKTILGAVENAELVYDAAEIRIAEGTYTEEEPITVATDLQFLGGYDDANWGMRESQSRWPVDDSITPQYPTTVRVDDEFVFNVNGDGLEVLLEHLSIVNTTLSGASETNAVFALTSTVTLRSVRVNGGGGAAAFGVAARSGAAVLENADVRGAEQGRGTGVLVGDGSLTVTGSRIHAGLGRTDDYTIGVALTRSTATIDSSFIYGGDAWTIANGIFCDAAELMLTNSVVLGGNSTAGSYTQGVYVNASTVTIRNNTIGSGTVAVGDDLDGSEGITLVNGSTSTIDNNIIFTEQGDPDVRRYGVAAMVNSEPTSFRNNAIFARTGTLDAEFARSGDPYVPVASVEDLNNGESFASGNVDVAAVFMVDAGGDDYRLDASTPTNIRQGGLDGAALGWGFSVDKDGAARTNLTEGPDDGPTNAGADGWSMGAFELD